MRSIAARPISRVRLPRSLAPYPPKPPRSQRCGLRFVSPNDHPPVERASLFVVSLSAPPDTPRHHPLPSVRAASALASPCSPCWGAHITDCGPSTTTPNDAGPHSGACVSCPRPCLCVRRQQERKTQTQVMQYSAAACVWWYCSASHRLLLELAACVAIQQNIRHAQSPAVSH